MRQSRFLPFYLALGWGYAAAIIWLSLSSLPEGAPTFPMWDKLAHALAYGGLMGWFVFLIERRRLLWIHAGLFTLMGAGLEVAQGLGGLRQPEIADAAANLAGIALACLFFPYKIRTS